MPPGRWMSWAKVKKSVRKWIKEIDRSTAETDEYARVSDLWSEAYQAREDHRTEIPRGHSYSRQSEENFENAPFTATEQAQISVQIKEIKTYIRSAYELTSEQISRIEAKLDHAEVESKRIGRKDWIVMFGGTLSSFMLTDLVPQHVVQHIVLMTVHGIGHLFGVGGSPLPLPSV